MINIIEILRFVLKNMFEKKSRVLLTISGIIIGIFTFTFFIFLSQGLTNAITEQFSSLGVNTLIVQSKTGSSGGGPGGEGLTDNDISKIKQVVRNYNYIAPAIFFQGIYEYGREREVITSLSYKTDDINQVYKDLDLEIGEGRLVRDGDKGVAMIGYKTATELYGEGKEIPLGASLKVKGQSLRVIGIIKERGDLFVDSSLFMSYDDIEDLSGQDTYSIIRISFEEDADLALMQTAIETKLNPNGEEERISITSPAQAIEQFEQILGALTLIISFVSSIALLVGGINVMNTMYSNVLERLNEISVLKALGATNADVLGIFLGESAILGCIGSIIGFLLAYILAKILSIAITATGYNVPVYFDFTFMIMVVIVTSFFAMIFGTYPAYKGTQVDPADNLRDD